ncbi:MAG: hypothetical protein O2840_04615 [bacterium]|nr:hypothetical protein [bacterium]
MNQLEELSVATDEEHPPVVEKTVAGIHFYFLDDSDHMWFADDDGAWQAALRSLVQYSPAKHICVEYVLPDMDQVFLRAAGMGIHERDQLKTSKRSYAEYVQSCARMSNKDIIVCDPARDWRWAGLLVGHTTTLYSLLAMFRKKRGSENDKRGGDGSDTDEAGITRRQFLFRMVRYAMLGALAISALSQVTEQALSLSAKTRVTLPANFQDLRRMVIAFNLLQLKNYYGITEYALTYPPVHREGIFRWLKILDGVIDQTPQKPGSMDSLFAVRRWQYDEPTRRWRRQLISF